VAIHSLFIGYLWVYNKSDYDERKKRNLLAQAAELFHEIFLDITFLSVFSVPLCFKIVGNTEAQRTQRRALLQRK
jgi:hypothetical protein